MDIKILFYIILGSLGIFILSRILNKKKNEDVVEYQEPQNQEEPNQIDHPVDADPEPTQVPVEPPVDIDDQLDEIPLDGEMPIKPKPIVCQKAAFKASPELYSYYDCCGNFFEGEGYQPWEKITPVSIDVNKPFVGMELLGEESQIEC